MDILLKYFLYSKESYINQTNLSPFNKYEWVILVYFPYTDRTIEHQLQQTVQNDAHISFHMHIWKESTNERRKERTTEGTNDGRNERRKERTTEGTNDGRNERRKEQTTEGTNNGRNKQRKEQTTERTTDGTNGRWDERRKERTADGTNGRWNERPID